MGKHSKKSNISQSSKKDSIIFTFSCEKMKSEENHVTVWIPRQLADEIDEIIQSRTLGYGTRAETVKEAK